MCEASRGVLFQTTSAEEPAAMALSSAGAVIWMALVKGARRSGVRKNMVDRADGMVLRCLECL